MYEYTLTNDVRGWKLEVWRKLPCGAELCGEATGPFDAHEKYIVLAGILAIGREMALKGYPPTDGYIRPVNLSDPETRSCISIDCDNQRGRTGFCESCLAEIERACEFCGREGDACRCGGTSND